MNIVSSNSAKNSKVIKILQELQNCVFTECEKLNVNKNKKKK